VEVNSNRLYDKRVSPVVAEVVAYASDILPAVVSTMGEEAVPVMKPFCDMTGPENVVFAMMCPYMQVKVYLSACRQPGLSDTPESPEWLQYTPKEKGAQGPLPVYQAVPEEPHIPRGSDQPKL
jgi:hypothetical protein